MHCLKRKYQSGIIANACMGNIKEIDMFIAAWIVYVKAYG